MDKCSDVFDIVILLSLGMFSRLRDTSGGTTGGIGGSKPQRFG